MPTPSNSYHGGQTTSTSVTTVASWASGDLLLAFGSTENGAATLTAIAGGGLTWTDVITTTIGGVPGNFSYLRVWVATPGSAGTSQTITATKSNAIQAGKLSIIRYPVGDHNGVGASSQTNSGGTAPSLALTTTGAGSAICGMVSDWNAVDGATRTWRTINSITPTAGNGAELLYEFTTGVDTLYMANWSNVGTAGAKTTGLSAPTGQVPAMVAIEVLAAAAVALDPTLTAKRVPTWAASSWRPQLRSPLASAASAIPAADPLFLTRRIPTAPATSWRTPVRAPLSVPAVAAAAVPWRLGPPTWGTPPWRPSVLAKTAVPDPPPVDLDPTLTPRPVPTWGAPAWRSPVLVETAVPDPAPVDLDPTLTPHPVPTWGVPSWRTPVTVEPGVPDQPAVTDLDPTLVPRPVPTAGNPPWRPPVRLVTVDVSTPLPDLDSTLTPHPVPTWGAAPWRPRVQPSAGVPAAAAAVDLDPTLTPHAVPTWGAPPWRVQLRAPVGVPAVDLDPTQRPKPVVTWGTPPWRPPLRLTPLVPAGVALDPTLVSRRPATWGIPPWRPPVRLVLVDVGTPIVVPAYQGVRSRAQLLSRPATAQQVDRSPTAALVTKPSTAQQVDRSPTVALVSKPTTAEILEVP